MNETVLQDLETLLIQGRELFAGSEPDLERWQKWGAVRQAIFARLKEANFQAAAEENPEIARLMADILKQDKVLEGKLREKLAGLSQEMAALSRMRLALVEDNLTHSTNVLDRLA